MDAARAWLLVGGGVIVVVIIVLNMLACEAPPANVHVM